MSEVVPTVTAIVLAHGEEPWLAECVDALLASEDVRVDVALVDNECTSPDLPAVGARDGVRLLRPGRNLGYAGGCNVAASGAPGQVLVFVNSDCVVEPGALSALARALDDPTVGLVTASVLLGDQPTRLNSAGNPVHFLGFSWAGELGQPAAQHSRPRDVASVSGACFATRASQWRSYGGFADEYFAYHEDVELSMRMWLGGLRVRYEPGASARHFYEFSRNPRKMYLLERNRLLTLLTVLDRRSLLLLLPALLTAEALVLALSVRQGWWRQKIAGWRWIVANQGWIRHRRLAAGSTRQRRDRALTSVLSTSLAPAFASPSTAVRLLDAMMAAYWLLVRRWW